MRNSENSMNINLDRKTVISKLIERRTALTIQKQEVEYEWRQYREDLTGYYIDIMGLLQTDSGNRPIANLITDCDIYHNRVRLEFTIPNTSTTTPYRSVGLPKRPERSEDSIQRSIDEVEQMIVLLEMCADDIIKSKSYGNILKYIC